jgi:hypothetical protein
MDNRSLVSFLERRIALAVDQIQAFKTKLDEAPASAMEWSDTTFTAAARHAVASICIRLIDKIGVEKTCERCLDEAISGARFEHQSTSQPSNLMHLRMTSEWAEMCNILNSVLSEENSK